ncbi:hypothetical protein [Cyanobium sp. WKJ7-Wakatipu]|uniref:hypothetical protein n=1 Tax=Cyanobium sp. WKJ7-Wakatipu TaxID=2823726 RepID=UPI0020CDB803|nr:hypothetical protein [Cyanobium sp. WKJ7-Wakatipu]
MELPLELTTAPSAGTFKPEKNTMPTLIKKGDRLRCKVRLALTGWKGFGYALYDEYQHDPEAPIVVRREGYPEEDCCLVARREVARCTYQRGLA